MQKEGVPLQEYPELKRLMETGEPVCITFETEEEDTEKRLEKAVPSGFLFCELVQKARMGERFRICEQGCPPGDYVLGLSEKSPAEYYLKSGRYRSIQASKKAALSLPRLKKEFFSIVIEPLSSNKGNFDVLILFLKPERAMRIVQANAYSGGKRTEMDTMGAASICGDCTVLALERGTGLSFGCKGSRKHSGYKDYEVPVGIAFDKIEEIEEGLSKIPENGQ